jgi:hypothetical protein
VARWLCVNHGGFNEVRDDASEENLWILGVVQLIGCLNFMICINFDLNECFVFSFCSTFLRTEMTHGLFEGIYKV